MKIMFYTCGLKKGGAERILVSLAHFFSNENEVRIITNTIGKSAYSLPANVEVSVLDKKEIKNFFQKMVYKVTFRRTRELKKGIEKEKPDVVFSFLSEPSIRLLRVKRKFKNLKTIICVRNHPKYEFKCCKFLRNYYYKYADFIVVQSVYYKKYFPKKLQSKIVTIPNFITDTFVPINHFHKNKKIVTVARLEKQKNLALLMKAYKRLKQNDYLLYIYGEGSLRKKLEHQRKRYHLENQVFLKGNVDNIREEIQDAALFVLTSNYEGFPNALLEAIALQIPVIVTDSTEVIHEIVNVKNGIIIPKNNVHELKKALEAFINHKGIWQELEETSFHIKKKYCKEKILKEWEKLLDKCREKEY